MFLNLNHILFTIFSNRLGDSANKLALKPRIDLIEYEMPQLSDAEKKSIIDAWGSISAGKINFDFWRFYKALEGCVNPLFVPDNIYWSRIIRALNPISLTRAYINKSLYPIIFKGLRQPTTLVNVINGIPYNEKMDRISFEAAADILGHYEDAIIIKPTVATSGGKGISILEKGSSLSEINQVFSRYKKNYICQGIVKQSKSTAIFNESSLNTFRVNTININGITTCECVMMRHGLGDSIVDNFAAGGVVCGMSKDGKFSGKNYDSRLQLVSNVRDGSLYTDHIIDNISDVIDAAISAHQRFMPHIGHAAWDFAINEHEQPVMIEVNLMLPGIIMEQLTSCSPIFGDRTEEVIKYAMHRNKTLKWTEFVGGWE